MTYRILVRFKNSLGDTVAYKIVDEQNKTYTISAGEAVKIVNNIVNAKLTANYEYKAIKGEHIRTLVYAKELKTKQRKKKVKDDIGVSGEVMHQAMRNALGVNYFKECIRIRELAQDGKLEIQVKSHQANNGANINMFKIIEACGLNVKNFINGYISVLQPFSLSDYTDRTNKSPQDNWWVQDSLYKYSMIIKISKKKDNEVYERAVVSFHESNIGGKYKRVKNEIISREEELRAVVIVDKAKYNNKTGLYNVEYTIQRGMLRFTVQSKTPFYRNSVAVVAYRDIDNHINSVIDKMIENIVSEFGEGSAINVDFKRGKLSFISYGHTPVNQVYMMIDTFESANNSERIIITSVVSEMLNRLSLQCKEELRLALMEKFEAHKSNEVQIKNKLYKFIMEVL